jgi:hypothetical protein
MVKFLSWIISSWWHILAAYLVGFAIFVALAVLVWGFVYRPSTQVSDRSAWDPKPEPKAWTGREIVEFALLQGLVWPLFGAYYGLLIVFGGALLLLVEAGDRLAAAVATSIPDDRPPGFQK